MKILVHGHEYEVKYDHANHSYYVEFNHSTGLVDKVEEKINNQPNYEFSYLLKKLGDRIHYIANLKFPIRE